MPATPWLDGPHRFNISYAVHGLQETRDCTETTFNPHNFLCFHLKFIRIGVCCIFNVFILNSVCTVKRIIHFYSPFFAWSKIVFSFWKNKHKSYITLLILKLKTMKFMSENISLDWGTDLIFLSLACKMATESQ